MSDNWHQIARETAPAPPIGIAQPPAHKACANCEHFARFIKQRGVLHGACVEFLVVCGWAPVVSETDGKFCVSFKDAGEG